MMVAHFKARIESAPAYEITKENVEQILGRHAPYYKEGKLRGDDQYFATCPCCDNPIQLKGLYKHQENSPRPYGSHTGTAVEGFRFDADDLEFCPYLTKHRSRKKSDRRPQIGDPPPQPPERKKP